MAAELGLLEVPLYRERPYQAEFAFAIIVDAPEGHPALSWASDYERGMFIIPPNSHEWERTDDIAVDLLQRVSRRYIHPTLGEAWVVEADPHQGMLRERQEQAERAASSIGRWLDIDD